MAFETAEKWLSSLILSSKDDVLTKLRFFLEF
jgi:hypothetical protein